MMDTTYFGRKYAYMIFRIRDKKAENRKNILRYKVNYETNNQYRSGIEFLQSKGFEITAIVCDGRQGLLGGFGDIPTQMCVKHQKDIATRYLTRKPKLEQSKELKDISSCLGMASYYSICERLGSRHERNKDRLYEKNENKNYIHIRVVKAYKSIKKNLYYCYMFEHYPEIGLPSTNNSLEAINSHIKTKSSIHRGLKEKRKEQFINYYLYYS